MNEGSLQREENLEKNIYYSVVQLDIESMGAN